MGLRISSVASGRPCGTLANFVLAAGQFPVTPRSAVYYETMSSMLKMSLAGLAACLAHGCTGESTTGLALPDLAAHQWKHRVLIIDTPSMQAAPYLQQISAFDAAAAGLKERDLEVITQTSAPAFRVRLVGKDGGVKLDRSTPMTTDELFTIIDAMPMRQDEVSNR